MAGVPKQRDVSHSVCAAPDTQERPLTRECSPHRVPEFAASSSVSSSRIQVMCINYQPFVGLSPKPLFDVHAETLSCSRRTLKTRPPPRRDGAGWTLSWAIYGAWESTRFAP